MTTGSILADPSAPTDAIDAVDSVLFDLDGTLIDTPSGIAASFAAAIAALGRPVPDDTAIRATIGTPLEEAFGLLLGVPPTDPLVADGIGRYQAAFREQVLPRAAELVYPGVVDGLAALAARGITLAVATSKYTASAEALLTAAGLRKWFRVVAGADRVTRPKPDAEIALLVLDELGARAERAVLVGDTVHDLGTAAAAGLRSIAVTYGVQDRATLAVAAPTWFADSFPQVLDRLEIDELLADPRHHIEFNGHLTNHAKHAVVALAGLGEPPARIRAWYDRYAALTPYGYGLEPARPATGTVEAADWTRHLGARTGYAEHVAFFADRVSELGVDEVLRRHAPTLLPGWAGAFTHAAIHLGFALDAGSTRMAVEGLAYLTFTHDPLRTERLRPDPATAGEAALDSLLRVAQAWERDGVAGAIRSVIADDSAAGIHPELARSGLQFRIARVLADGHPLIDDIPLWIDEQDAATSWAQLRYVTALLYLTAPGDFVLLHLITSQYAVERIAERLPDEQAREAVRWFWAGTLSIVFAEAKVPQAAKLAALHAAFDGATDEPGPAIEREWRLIVARAVEEEEEHNPKLVHVLRRVWRESGGRTVFRVAAAQFTATPELPASFAEAPHE